MPRIPPRNLLRQRPRRRRINSHITRPQLWFCERLIKIVRVALTQQLVIEDDGLVDEGCEGLLRVQRCGCGREGEIESSEFDFGAGEGIGKDDLLDTGGELIGIGGNRSVGIVFGVEGAGEYG